MTCEQAIEILPWYLNGTLEAREREEVRHHLATCEACRQALDETREAWRIFDQHLPSEALVALAWGETPAGIDPTLAERHLAGCPQCAAELELARMSRHLEDNPIALFPPKPAPAPRETRGDGEHRTWRRATLAASLAAVVGISGWIYSAQMAGPGTEVPPQIAQASEPKVNVTSLTLNPEEILRGGTGGQEILDEDDHVVRVDDESILFLNPSDEAETTYETYEIEIRKPEEEPFWRRRDLRLTEEGDFSLTLPPGYLKPGTYEIRVFGLRDGQRGEQVGMYQVTAR
jgi:anti-sigma factor RsiW